jgi:hypothetical protein
VGTVTFNHGVSAEANGFMSLPYPHPMWDREKNEMELFTLARNTKFNGEFDFSFYVAFGEVGLAAGRPLFPVLEGFVKTVETIIGEIETESRRLGIAK